MKSILSAVCSLVILLPISVVAQTDYGKLEDGAISYFEQIAKSMEGIKGGQGVSLPPASEDVLHYISAAYLYCSIKNGTCPFIIDAVREVDVVNSRLKKEAQCPNMVLFWKKWIANGFEERMNYNVATGFLTMHMDFKKNERPKYIKCNDSVKEIISPDLPDSEFFQIRYSGQSPYGASPGKLAAYLKEIKSRGINPFISTGAHKAPVGGLRDE